MKSCELLAMAIRLILVWCRFWVRGTPDFERAKKNLPQITTSKREGSGGGEKGEQRKRVK